MYENESYKSNAQSESDWTREERALEAHLERQEAKARREPAVALREVTGYPRPCDACYEDDTRTVACSHIAAPVAMALDGWLKAVAGKKAA